MLRRHFLGLWALGIFPLVGCDEQPVTRVATNVWPGYEPLYCAREAGELPVGVKLVELLSATQVMAALRTGLVEGGALTLDEALTLVGEGVPVTVVGVFDVSAGGDALVARNFSDLAGLRGRKLGVEKTALGAYFTSRVLEIAGLRRDEVSIVHLDISEHERAFSRGEVDAVVTFDPVRARLLARGGRVVFDSRSLPDEIVDVLVVRRQVLDDASARRDLGLVLRAFDAVVRRIGPGRPELEVMSRRLGVAASEVSGLLSGVRLTTLADMERLLSPAPGAVEPPLRAQAARLARTMVDAGLLAAVPALDPLLDARVLREGRA